MEKITIKNFKQRLHDLGYYMLVDEKKYNAEYIGNTYDAKLTRTDYITFCIDEMNFLQ